MRSGAIFSINPDGSGVQQLTTPGPDWSLPAGSSIGKAATSTAVSCNYVFATFSESCTATVGGGATPPTGTVSFSSPSGGVFPFGNTCTLAHPTAATAFCQVSYTPPSQSLTVITTLEIAATVRRRRCPSAEYRRDRPEHRRDHRQPPGRCPTGVQRRTGHVQRADRGRERHRGHARSWLRV